MDLIYNPATLFLKYAKELSIPCANRLTCWLHRLYAEEIWQGTTYDQDIIDEIAKVWGSG